MVTFDVVQPDKLEASPPPLRARLAVVNGNLHLLLNEESVLYIGCGGVLVRTCPDPGRVPGIALETVSQKICLSL